MRIFAENKKAYFKYKILEKIEAGIALIGQEVKSIKLGRINLTGSYIVVKNEEIYLIGCSIPAYQPKNAPKDYAPERSKKLLLKKSEIKQLIGKHIPIRINNQEETAEVEAVTPFLMGYRVLFSIGTFDLQKYIYKLNDFYKEEKRFEIEIIDGVGFKAAKYFDIPNNNWKLDKLVPSVLEARKLCKTIDQVGS